MNITGLQRRERECERRGAVRTYFLFRLDMDEMKTDGFACSFSLLSFPALFLLKTHFLASLLLFFLLVLTQNRPNVLFPRQLFLANFFIFSTFSRA